MGYRISRELSAVHSKKAVQSTPDQLLNFIRPILSAVPKKANFFS
jgi:hypothetical protein